MREIFLKNLRIDMVNSSFRQIRLMDNQEKAHIWMQIFEEDMFLRSRNFANFRESNGLYLLEDRQIKLLRQWLKHGCFDNDERSHYRYAEVLKDFST